MSENPIPPHRRLRVLVADNHPIIRKRIREILEEHPDFEVCAEVEDGGKAIEVAQQLTPDVILLDPYIPALGGFTTAQVIKTTVPKSAIVVLSMYTEKPFVEAARRIGARAFVAKTKAAEALVAAIEAAIAGGEDFVAVT